MNVNKYLAEKFPDEDVRRGKRKRIDTIMKKTTKLDDLDEEDNSYMTLKVRSSDGKKKYSVNIGYRQNKGVYFECSCGDQFGLSGKRNSCRHVATAVLQMNKTFLDNHVKDGKAQSLDPNTLAQIVSLLEKFDI